MSISIYDRGNLETLPWEAIHLGEQLKAFFTPLIMEGTSTFIINVSCELALLVCERHVLPLAIANSKKTSPPNAYVASMLTQYIRYPAEEIMNGEKYPASLKFMVKWLEKPMLAISRLAGYEKAVFVNNWLLSTNLWPKGIEQHLPEIVAFLKVQFPRHALVLKSVNEMTEKPLLESATALHMKQIVSRRVYMLDTLNDRSYEKKRPLKQDKKLEKQQTQFVWKKVQHWDCQHVKQALSFYIKLYLEKHSVFNPIYNERFLQIALQGNALAFDQLFENETLVAIQAYAQQAGLFTTPLIGYEQSIPREKGIYRMMHLQLLRKTEESAGILNMSSGAGEFKQKRGGKPVFEYNVVYDAHLPKRFRMAWAFLYKFSNKSIKQNMERYHV